MAVKGKASLADLRQTISELEAELEKRTAERDEGLARETAVAELLQVINSSPGDLAPVFDAMLEKALALCDAAFGVLWARDGEFYRAAAFRGLPPAYAEFVSREPRGLEPGGALGRLAGGEALTHVRTPPRQRQTKSHGPTPN
jgi:hypothetical protein